MELERITEFVNEITNIPTAILGLEGIEVEFGIRLFQPSPATFFIQPILNRDTEQIVDVMLSHEQVMCGYVIDMKSRRALLLGPTMEHTCTRKNALNILKRMELPYKRTDELMSYFEKIPTMALTTFIRHLYFIHYIINDQLPPSEDWYVTLAEKLGQDRTATMQAEHLVHNSREWDRCLEACIEYGKLEELEEFMRNIRSQGRMGMVANDSLRSMKNIAISSITLISRAASRGGMEYEAALTLSDEYIRRVEALNSFSEVQHLLVQSFFDFTKIVSQIHELKSRSKLVYAVVSYVRKNIDKPIQVSEIAKELGHNASYLCRTFKRETGKTLKEYINEMKLEEAKFLLRSTRQPIVNIALELGYSSQAYFTTLFRNYTGNTPVEFREKNI